jgi:hypothetical protein
LGLSLSGVQTALNVERGMRLIGTAVVDLQDEEAEQEAPDGIDDPDAG